MSSHNLLKSDSRADVLAENSELASSFIKALFGILYEVYSSSVSNTIHITISEDGESVSHHVVGKQISVA